MNRLYLWLQHRPTVVDVIIATPIGLLMLVASGPASPTRDVSNVAAQLALLVAIAIRRRWFTVAYLLVMVVGLINVVAGTAITIGPAHLAMPILLYTAATIGPRWARLLGLFWIPVAPVLAMVAMDVYGTLRAAGHTSPWSATALAAGLFAAPLAAAWIWGDSVRTRRQFYEELADRAHRLERERDALDRAAVAEERARIARELHDVVAHHVSVMVVQADGAAYAIDTAPVQAREALGTISRTGREALTEMRSLLGLLRSGDAPDGAGLTPQPGLDSIEDLVTQLRETGLPVQYAVAGRPRSVAAGVGLTAYRVVQESLTNALKHGGPGVRATVRLGWARDRLRVEVSDDGRGAPAAGSAPTAAATGGHGIIGMRERVTAAGGALRAGARPGGGYRVTATLPFGSGKGEAA